MILKYTENVIRYKRDAMGRRVSIPQGYYVFDKYNKKLFISKRDLALSIFGGILVNVFAVGLCAAAIAVVDIFRSSAP